MIFFWPESVRSLRDDEHMPAERSGNLPLWERARCQACQLAVGFFP